MDGSLGSVGSLLVPVTLNEPGARPETASIDVTTPTCTSLWFGGQSVQPAAGKPEITGGVLSILIVTGTELVRSAPFVTLQVNAVLAVSAVSVVGVQPVEEAMPDSGSLTPQFTVTL